MANNSITIDAETPKMEVISHSTGGDYGEQQDLQSTLTMNGSLGEFSARNEEGVAQVSASGIFCNNAGTQAVAASTGLTRRAAIVGLGYGTLNKDQWTNENFLAGVYGTAYNFGTAPAYGGYFNDLMAAGVIMNQVRVDNNTGTLYLSSSQSVVIGLSSQTKTIYLPNDAVMGRIILVKNIWTGTLRFYPRSGQKIYDDSSENSYYDFNEQRGGIFIFTKFYLNGVLTECWTVNRYTD